MDPLRFAKFEFEETYVDGVCYRLPIINLNQECFKEQSKSKGQSSKRETDKQKWRFEEMFKDEEGTECQPYYQVDVKDGNNEFEENDQGYEEPLEENKIEKVEKVTEDEYIDSSEKSERMNLNSRSFQPKIKRPTRFDAKPREYTHFIALPCKQKTLCKKLVDFQYKVEEFDAGKSLYDQWFAEDSSFHFTLLMLPLETKEAIDKASDILKQMEPEIKSFLFDKNFTLNIKGVGHFPISKGSEESSVLYACIDREDHDDSGKIKCTCNYCTLCDITDMIIKRMLLEKILFENELGYVEYDEELDKYSVQFHLTLINTSFLKVEGQNSGFQGKKIVEKFEDENFGKYNPRFISLYRRKRVDGKYLSVIDISIQ